MSNHPLAGQLRFRPGAKDAAIVTTRAPLAARLLRGTSAAATPAKLGALYALCGNAHSLTAQLAIDAALGVREQPTWKESIALKAETMREHARRIWLDWPRLFGAASPDAKAMSALRACPLFQESSMPDAPTMRSWVEREFLGESLPAWLQCWRADAHCCLDCWTEQGETFPATLLRGIAEDAQQWEDRAIPLLPHARPEAMRRIAQAIDADETFEMMPSWQGSQCSTGSWTRLASADSSAARDVRGAWLRLGARVAELAALGSDMQPPLALGALRTSAGEAIAWCEMARGLLLHRVRIEQEGQEATIADYRIVAPTEWNFHPQGVVAASLARMPAARTDAQRAQASRRIGVLAAAFDPCVNYQIGFEHA